MKIVSLVAENIKKLKAVEISPKGEVVTIAGRNGAGKTSVMDSIWWALAGTSHIQSQPIRQGENKARIKLDLGELIVERKFTDGGSTLSVQNAEGARFPSPQKMLDSLLGALSFDPLAFSRMSPRDQFNELRRIVKLEIDIDELDRLNAGDFATRTNVNREAKFKRAQAQGVSVPSDLPASLLDENALIDAIQQAGEHNAAIESEKALRQRHIEQANSKRNESMRLKESAVLLRKQAEQAEQQAHDLAQSAHDLERQVEEAGSVGDPIDVAALRANLDRAKAVNAGIAKREQRRKLEKESEELERQSKLLTEQMEARNKAKSDAIGSASMPIDGLSFGDGFVTYNGIPLEQTSSAEQLKISLSIAMSSNPKLKVIRIVDGSLLDEDSMASIAEIAKERGYQVWVEKVDSSGKTGILIEDGMVAAIDGERVQFGDSKKGDDHEEN